MLNQEAGLRQPCILKHGCSAGTRRTNHFVHFISHVKFRYEYVFFVTTRIRFYLTLAKILYVNKAVLIE